MAAPLNPIIDNLSVLESAPIGTVIGTVNSSDPDGTPVTYQLVPSTLWNDPNDGWVEWIEANQGPDPLQVELQGDKIVLTGPLDFEKIDGYLDFGFFIIATDGNGESTKINFRLNVVDVDEAVYLDGSDDTFNGTNDLDEVYGYGGNDKLYGFGGNDHIDGGSGDDLIKGGLGNDILKGSSGNDRIYGESGHDVISGGLGYDVMSGGTGRDTFIFENHTTSKVSKPDVITDFIGTGQLDISGIDGNTRVSGNQEFDWIGKKSFSGNAGELRYEVNGKNTFVYADINGDKKADFALELKSVAYLNEGMFVL